MSEGPMFGIIGTVLFLILCLCGVMIYREAEQWERFRAAHSCRVVAHIPADVAIGFTSGGNMATTTIPSKTGWLCNDGITYFR